ncbi:YjbF family lipoprotein [Sedimentitalea sp. XS_ASV28]|uniref:YjbF family lipoprotein n=1 Tax=Sedimentitalea sp. XS_ASV28 TaxID=3241296 RepID=UPI003517529A
MRRSARLVAGLVIAILLAACSGGSDAPTLNLQVIEAARAAIAARTNPPAERPPVTRAVLDTLDGTFLEITREREDVTAFLYPSYTTRDSEPGEIVVWRTDSNETVTVRGGVLIATRGLGGDLLSTEVLLAGSRPGPAEGGARTYRVFGENNRQTTLAMACEVTDMGPETIEIIEIRHATRHLREQCQGSGGVITNEYWIDARRGLIRQSRQWAGPHVGYLRLRQVTD